jgi:hypothetical protein
MRSCCECEWTNTLSFAALAVACRDVDVRNVRAIIIGPPETPYEFGFFEVRLLVLEVEPVYSNIFAVLYQVRQRYGCPGTWAGWFS